MMTAAPGCSFCPAEKELTDVYLHGKIACAGRDAGVIHVADVYSADPETLAKAFAPAVGTGRGDKDPVWYFFSPVHYASKKKNSGRRSRTIAGDSSKKWHSEIGAVPVEGGSAVGGHKLTLTYMVRDMASGEKKHERAGWILAEFGISPEHGGGQLELCKLHRSPRFKEETTSRADGSKKRKAAADDELYATNRHKNLCLRQEMPLLREIEMMDGGAAALDPQELCQRQEAPILDDTGRWTWTLQEIERQLLSGDDGGETMGGADVPKEDEGGAGTEQGGGCDEDDGRFECTYEELLGIDDNVEDDMAAAAAACVQE